jgi:hypothetical protein
MLVVLPFLWGAWPTVTGFRMEKELGGAGMGWTDVTEDLLEAVNLEYGISGAGPLDLVASTGQISYAMDNSEDNSAGLVGYYSPQRFDVCRPGFKLGIGVRYFYRRPLTNDYYHKFLGRVKRIAPAPGLYAERKTVCGGVDWIDEAAQETPDVPTLIGKRANEIITALVDSMDRQPYARQFATGVSVFPYADTGEGAPVLTGISRACQSEFTRCYLRGGLDAWSTLVVENRATRLTPMPIVTFHGTMQTLGGSEDASKIKNVFRVTAHPKRVDVAATTVLYDKPSESNPAIAPGQTLKIVARWSDPATPTARVAAIDIETPAPTTHYLMNGAADGSGANLTANFTVVATLSANQGEYLITNNGGVSAFLTKLKSIGRAVKDFDPITAETVDAASIAENGRSVVSLDMPFQSDAAIAQAVADFGVSLWKVPGMAEIEIKFIPRDNSEFLAVIALEPGDPVALSEQVTGANGVYYIQKVSMTVEEAGLKVTFQFVLQRALVEDYWTLGIAGLSELGITTILAPL